MVVGTCVSLRFDRAHVIVVFANGITHIEVALMRMRAPTDFAATLLNMELSGAQSVDGALTYIEA